MSKIQNLKRPLIDIDPDASLKFYGYRIDRGSNIYATTTPMTHGRPNPNYEVRIGSVERIGRIWVGRTLSGMPFEGERQQDAAKHVYRWTEEHQS